MEYLHSKQIMHRDLKPENILMDIGGRILICDFGFSKILPTFSAKAQSLAGTYPYMPPEMLLGEVYGNSADVWAASLIFLELLLGHDAPKFNGNSKEEVLSRFKEIVDLNFPKHISLEAKDLYYLMLNERPSFTDLSKHPYLQ